MQKLEVEGQGIKTTTEFLHSSVQELKAVVWSQVFSLLGQPRTTEVDAKAKEGGQSAQ